MRRGKGVQIFTFSRFFEFLVTLGIGAWLGIFVSNSPYSVSSTTKETSAAFRRDVGTLIAVEPEEHHAFSDPNVHNEEPIAGTRTSTASDGLLMGTDRPRLLFMSAVYSFDQFLYLQKLLDAMRDHCNAGWNVTVHLQVANGLHYLHPRYVEIQDRLYCYDMKAYVPVILESYGKIGFGLNAKHRAFVRSHIEDFDYFSYAEEDMLLSVSHLRAIIEGEKMLKRALPKTWLRYTIGFFRWEDSIVDSERVSWEYFPDRMHVVDMGPKLGKMVVTNNINQAIYVFSKQQLCDLEKRCGFLTDVGQNKFYVALRKAMDADWKYLSAGVSEWSSSFQQVLQCGLRRIVPLNHLQTFMIQHTTNKAQKRRLRRELLNMTDWMRIVDEKSKHPITLDEAYKIIYEQYNLHLIDTKLFEGRSKWSWEVAEEPKGCIPPIKCDVSTQ